MKDPDPLARLYPKNDIFFLESMHNYATLLKHLLSAFSKSRIAEQRLTVQEERYSIFLTPFLPSLAACFFWKHNEHFLTEDHPFSAASLPVRPESLWRTGPSKKSLPRRFSHGKSMSLSPARTRSPKISSP